MIIGPRLNSPSPGATRSVTAVANFEIAAAGSTGGRARSATIRRASSRRARRTGNEDAGHAHADDDADEAEETQQRDHSDHAQARQRATLPGGLRRTEKSVRDDDERERIERRRQPIVELRPILVTLRHIDRIVGLRPHQLPKVFFARGKDDVVRAAGEFRQVEGVMIEGHDTRIALADLESLDAAAFEYQERAVVVLDDLALLREVGGAFAADRGGRRRICRREGRSACGRRYGR